MGSLVVAKRERRLPNPVTVGFSAEGPGSRSRAEPEQAQGEVKGVQSLSFLQKMTFYTFLHKNMNICRFKKCRTAPVPVLKCETCNASAMVRSAVVSKTVRVAVSGPERASPCRQTPMSRLISGAGALCARLDFPALLFVLAEPPRPCALGHKEATCLWICGSLSAPGFSRVGASPETSACWVLRSSVSSFALSLALLNYSYHDITQETVGTALLHLPVPVREGEELLTPPWTLISLMNIFKDVPLHLCLFIMRVNVNVMCCLWVFDRVEYFCCCSWNPTL